MQNIRERIRELEQRELEAKDLDVLQAIRRRLHFYRSLVHIMTKTSWPTKEEQIEYNEYLSL